MAVRLEVYNPVTGGWRALQPGATMTNTGEVLPVSGRIYYRITVAEQRTTAATGWNERAIFDEVEVRMTGRF